MERTRRGLHGPSSVPSAGQPDPLPPDYTQQCCGAERVRLTLCHQGVHWHLQLQLLGRLYSVLALRTRLYFLCHQGVDRALTNGMIPSVQLGIYQCYESLL